MKAPTVDDFAALIGIDWADQKHDICENPTGSKKYLHSVVSSKPESIDNWAMNLKIRYPNKQVAIACELQKGPLINALSKYSHLTIFPLNPSSVAKYRQAFTPSGAKDDPSDAYLQAEILALHMDKLTVIQPESAEIRALSQLVEYRRKIVQDRVDLTNKITATLKNYYPQVLEWFSEKDTIIFCDFIKKWPSLMQAKKAKKQSLQTFFNQHNSRYPEVNATRISLIKKATTLTDDLGVIEPNKILIEILIPQLKVLIKGIEQLDSEIKQRYKKQKDRVIFDSFPGAGPQLAPRLLAAFGTKRDRYTDASALQKYAGIAPVIERSGKQKWVHWRYSCPKFLRQTFVEWAGLSVRFSFWAKAYYEQQKSKGKPHNVIIRSLAFKWIRIAFRCWKTRTPYNESMYLEALKRRDSPLLKFAVGA
ncbi:IS110 family transposase [Thalassomonas actiniarum]|uniref:IS110 family transposase n=1 Tax=Thalassomonas actiniarum TaxID=485447 RepID=A0AAE9YV35_9GAMM|nr:IS110 family transposase [Thalassomonas actiniarum]WDD99291.1 IS110 family transposase [Thalassomonas actiniarum]WDD99368.1 IS110 family transposase [Thalassomonas actiniarum]WDE01686.1 IS110 family transposase [Thalassomonas actiniarum]